jgi:hypothetical protein
MVRMSQIFISHSKKDKKIKRFFSDIFVGTNSAFTSSSVFIWVPNLSDAA